MYICSQADIQTHIREVVAGAINDGEQNKHALHGDDVLRVLRDRGKKHYLLLQLHIKNTGDFFTEFLNIIWNVMKLSCDVTEHLLRTKVLQFKE